MFNRFDICEAYWLYETLWGPAGYAGRLARIPFEPGQGLTLETASEEVKAIYGRLVRKHNRIYVAYDRYCRRNPKARPWPGTSNMRGGPWEWVARQGLRHVIETYA